MDNKTTNKSNEAHLYVKFETVNPENLRLYCLASNVENGMEDLKMDKRILQRTGEG